MLLPLLAAGAALVAAACGGGDVTDEEFEALRAQVGALQTELSETQEVAQRALLIAALPALDTNRFHTIDEQINNEGLIHATTPGFVRRAVETLTSVEWPAKLAENVEQFRGAAAALLGPVADNDVDASGRPALVAHAIAHAFNDAVDAYLAGDAIPAPPAISEAESHEHAAEEHDEDEGNDEDEDHDE